MRGFVLLRKSFGRLSALNIFCKRQCLATWLACGGLSDAYRRPSHFSLLAQREVTKRNGLTQPGEGYKQARSRFVCQDTTQEELPPLCRERSLAEARKARLAAHRQAETPQESRACNCNFKLPFHLSCRGSRAVAV